MDMDGLSTVSTTKNGKGTLRSQIRMLIQKRIREGVYKPGDRIVETRLCKELSVSQAPVREAVLELAMMGILEERPYSGTYVREIRIEEVEDIYNIRAFIEEYATRRACTHGSDEALEKIGETVRRMEECASKEELADVDREFHEAIMEASGSKALMTAWSSLQISQWTYESILNTGLNMEELVEGHRQIYDCIARRQDHTAGAMMFLHIRGFGEELAEILRKKEDGRE